MSMYLNELELLKVAQKIEEEGLRFYTQAMENAKDENTRKVFEILAYEEKAHSNLFSKLYLEAKESINNEDDYIFNEELSSYLRAISETAVFNTNGLTNSKVKEVKDSKEALLVGIQAEKDAILFYSKLNEVAKFESTKKYLKELIKEENGHLEHLLNLYKSL